MNNNDMHLLLDGLLSHIQQSNQEQISDTILSVIGREYDEDLISRLLVYVIREDASIQYKLLERYFSKNGIEVDLEEGLTLDYVQPEFVMGQGRADIFASFNKSTITITIENKINTAEHDTGNQMQTEAYQRYVNSTYRNAKNAFIYLKPDWNLSVAADNAFMIIKYSELLELISTEAIENDHIIKEFVEHVRAYLGGKTMAMTEVDLTILKDYEVYHEALYHFRNNLIAFKKDLTDRICDGIESRLQKTISKDWSKYATDDELFYEIAHEKDLGIGSFRVYKRKWYKENEYYFYVEIKFESGLLDKDKIKYQCTLKDYLNQRTKNDNSCKMKRFIEAHNNKRIHHESTTHFHVYKCVPSANAGNAIVTGETVKELFIKESIDQLCSFLNVEEDLFKEYIAFA